MARGIDRLEHSKTGGWSTAGELFTGDSLKSVTLQANLPIADSYTVEFGVQGPNGAPVDSSGNPVQTEALISWTVEGNTVTRRVSVGNGTSITGTAAAIRVTVNDTTVNLGRGVPAGDPYTVWINVSPGVRGASKQPPTLARLPPPTGIITVAGGASAAVAIPQDAGVTSVYVTAIAGNGLLGQVVVNHQTGVVPTKEYDPRVYSDWVPVSPGATQIGLGCDVTSGGCDFSVTFGIDG